MSSCEMRAGWAPARVALVDNNATRRRTSGCSRFEVLASRFVFMFGSAFRVQRSVFGVRGSASGFEVRSSSVFKPDAAATRPSNPNTNREARTVKREHVAHLPCLRRGVRRLDLQKRRVVLFGQHVQI